MLIKILKGEELFSKQGTHICDSKGIALVATEDTECEVDDRIDMVKSILKQKRLDRNLDEEGNPIVAKEEKTPEQEILPPSDQQVDDTIKE